MALALLSGCLEQTKLENNAQTVQAYFSAVKDNEMIVDKTISVENGTNALEAMQEVAEVGYKEYAGMGALVTSINGIESSDEYYWALYVDGKYADKGISAYTVENDMNITMIYTPLMGG